MDARPRAAGRPGRILPWPGVLSRPHPVRLTACNLRRLVFVRAPQITRLAVHEVTFTARFQEKYERKVACYLQLAVQQQ